VSLTVMSWEEAIGHAKEERLVHALLGNGFSRACFDDIFSYDALFDRADFQSLSEHCQSAFDELKTTDFEEVIRALRVASIITSVYHPDKPGSSARMAADADQLREVLVNAIAGSHPDWPGEIDAESYAACKIFLANFERVYTLNYDLLLYWTFMQDEIEPDLQCDDGFRHADDGEEEYVTWEVDQSYDQKVYYLHGALHLFDSGTQLQKYTWSRTGVRLIDQIRAALENSKFPLFVSEGTSEEKLTRIKHHGYLHRGIASIGSITGSLVIHGMSFGPNDNHVIRILERGRVSRVYVGLYGCPEAPHNRAIVERALAMSKRRDERAGRRRRRPGPLEVYFYDAQSANVWGDSV